MKSPSQLLSKTKNNISPKLSDKTDSIHVIK